MTVDPRLEAVLEDQSFFTLLYYRASWVPLKYIGNREGCWNKTKSTDILTRITFEFEKKLNKIIKKRGSMERRHFELFYHNYILYRDSGVPVNISETKRAVDKEQSPLIVLNENSFEFEKSALNAYAIQGWKNPNSNSKNWSYLYLLYFVNGWKNIGVKTGLTEQDWNRKTNK